MKELVGGCCVCADEQGWSENPLVYCDGSDCNVAVHQACYGIVTVPSGEWFCRRCESQEKPTKVRCELCPSKYGALKRADTGGWAHVICALYIPEVRFGNVSTMEPIIVAHIPRDRFDKKCYICENAGRDGKAATGACMQCNRNGCMKNFHVTCGQMEGLLCEEAGNHGDNVKYNGYCSHHLSKVKRSHNVKFIPPFKPIPPRESSPDSSPGKNSPAHFSLSIIREKKKKGVKRPSSAGSAGSSGSSGKGGTRDLISSSVIVEPSSNASHSLSDLSPPEDKPNATGGWIPIPEAGGFDTSSPALDPIPQQSVPDEVKPLVTSSAEDMTIKVEPDVERDVLREAIKELENEAKRKEGKNRRKRPQTPPEPPPEISVTDVDAKSDGFNQLDLPQTTSARTVSPLIISTAGTVHVTKVSEKHKVKEVDDSPQKREMKKRGRPPKSSKPASPRASSNYDSDHSSGSDGESGGKRRKKVSEKPGGPLTNGLHTAPHMLGNHLNPNTKFSQQMVNSIKEDCELGSEEQPSSTWASSTPVANGVTTTQPQLTGVPFPGKKPSVPPVVNNTPSSLEELLELQWQQGSSFLMDQAQSFDIASILSLLHTIRIENMRLEEQYAQLQQRRDHLLAVQARLSLPLQYTPSSLPQQTPPAHQSSSSTRERRPSDYMPPPAHSGSVENGYDGYLRNPSVVVSHERIAPSPVIVSGNCGVISTSPSLRHTSQGHYDDRSPAGRNLVSPGAAHSASVLRSASNTPEILRSGTPQQSYGPMYQVVNTPVAHAPPAAHGNSSQSTATAVSVVTSQYQQFNRRDIPRADSVPRAHERR